MTEEKYTEEVLDESEELNETALEEMADGDDPSVEDSDQMALDMETKNQQFEEDTEKVLELLQNGDYFDTRSLLLSYNEVDIAEIFEVRRSISLSFSFSSDTVLSQDNARLLAFVTFSAFMQL